MGSRERGEFFSKDDSFGFRRRLNSSILWRALLAIAVAKLSISLCSGQLPSPCDSSLKPASGTRAYQQRGTRCEGLFDAKVSAPSGSLSLVSLTEGPLRFELKQGVVLRITASNVTDRELKIRAVPIPLDTYYRMDAVLSAGRELKWPVDDVLEPEHLYDRRLGVVGWLTERDRPTYVPLTVTPTPGDAPTKSEPVIATVRSSVDVYDVRWRISDFKSGRCGRFSLWELARRKLRGSTPLYLTIPPGRGQASCVEVRCRESNSDRKMPLLEFRFRR